MRRWRTALGFVGLVLATAGCDWRERVRVLTPHERYGRALVLAGLDSTALGRDWLGAERRALRSPFAVTVPFREEGFFSRSEAVAVAYRLPAHRGEQIHAVLTPADSTRTYFLDLYEATDSLGFHRHRASARANASGAWELRHDVENDATFLLRLQPELLREGRYALSVQIGPQLAFPVDGVTNDAAKSFFGAERDGGRRRHEGVDIFAPRGTAVLATSSGVVESTAPNELGGRVVWLFDEARKLSVYYAHLDRQLVRAGEFVEPGDTLGTVGNTGNARTTPPHLHFGLYRRGEGAIDPWPWIRVPKTVVPTLAVDSRRLGSVVVLSRTTTVVRSGAAPTADSLFAIRSNDALLVVGAQGAAYRVQDAKGRGGYVAAADVGRRINARHPADVRQLLGAVESTR